MKSKKDIFINFIQTEIFDQSDIWFEDYQEVWSDIESFWEEFKNNNSES